MIIIGLGVFIFSQRNNKEIAQEISTPDKTSQVIPPVNGKNIVGICSICEKELNEETHFEIDSIHLCKDHYNTYIKNNWVEICNQRTTADTPEAGVYIYNFQKKLWKNEQVPSFILCEYKIDIETDNIETYVRLNVLKDMATDLKERLERNKVMH